jgi:hypothetical protein
MPTVQFELFENIRGKRLAQLTKFGLAWSTGRLYLQSGYFIPNSADLVHIFLMEEIISG